GRLLAPQKRFPMGWVVLAALAHALLIELVQLALPQRSTEGADVVFDVIGIALGFGLWLGERLRRRASAGEPEVEVAMEGASSPSSSGSVTSCSRRCGERPTQ